MKLFASILLTLSLATLAVAAPFTAFSVTSLTRTVNGSINGVPTSVYRATVSTSKTSTKSVVPFINGDQIIIATTECDHVPATGETAIVSNGPLGQSLLFSGGITCKVKSIDLAEKH